MLMLTLGRASCGLSSSRWHVISCASESASVQLRVVRHGAAFSSASSDSAMSSSASDGAPTTTTSKPLASQTTGTKHGTTVYGITASNGRFDIQQTHEHVFKLWKQQHNGADSVDAATSQVAHAKALLRNSTERAADFMWDLFLPKDAKTSVTKDYFPYVQWYFVGSIASAATGVLSMQSLLYAIGLGAGSIPTAAAVNWVLKDGLGQFGGVMFASVVNNRYDADPKRWRTASAVALDAAVLMEILTPLCPVYFLPIASLANVAKNISWLSASATRAGFHNSFAMKENLADVTAKAGSQSIASSILGTGLGIGLSQITGASTLNVLGAFGVLSAFHLFSIYKSLACVTLRTLNSQRLHLVARHFLDNNAQVPDLETVSQQEKFMPHLIVGYASLYDRSYVNMGATLAQLSGSSPDELLRLKEFYSNDKYLLNIAFPSSSSKTSARVDVALEDDATSKDALCAQLHAALAQKALETTSFADPASAWTLVEQTYRESRSLRTEFLEHLKQSDWHIENLLVEEQSMRYKWLV